MLEFWAVTQAELASARAAATVAAAEAEEDTLRAAQLARIASQREKSLRYDMARQAAAVAQEAAGAAAAATVAAREGEAKLRCVLTCRH